ncbi:MAG: hypothetical protein KF699_15395 [Phycisphaeraceae bacterium]|nr:hypothetical protein [Phycisphaeraceae bacterium]
MGTIRRRSDDAIGRGGGGITSISSVAEVTTSQWVQFFNAAYDHWWEG